MKELDITNRNLKYQLNLGDIVEEKLHNGKIVRGEIISISANAVPTYFEDTCKGSIEWHVFPEYQEITAPDYAFVTYMKWIFDMPEKYKIYKRNS